MTYQERKRREIEKQMKKYGSHYETRWLVNIIKGKYHFTLKEFDNKVVAEAFLEECRKCKVENDYEIHEIEVIC